MIDRGLDPSRSTVSVVVNTLDRADSLEDLLRSCTQLTHPRFEVVVVAGPCSDHSDEVLERWTGRIKVRRCGEANLSMSRNVGIAASAGDIVAFIDDDGIPEPTWLDEIAAAYEAQEVGAVGGLVYNHTGHAYQVRFMLSDRLGNTVEYDDMPPGDFCFPGSSRYPSMLGCNSSFRRSALVSVGGFDEEYDYYLDETDVCLRLVDAGWRIVGLDSAPVHHKYLPSGIRTSTKVVTNNHSVVKNKVYFSMVNGRDHWAWTDLMSDNVNFTAMRREEMHRQAQAGAIESDGLAEGVATIDSGWEAGIRAGLRGRRSMLEPTDLEDTTLEAFDANIAEERKRFVFITRTLPPENPGGVGRYMLDLARELVSRGHEVRIVTSGADHDRVDLEQGVWVHRIVKRSSVPPPAGPPVIPEVLWHNAGPVAEEVVRICRERPVDLVLSSVWDVEFADVIRRTSIPVVASYVTPFSVVWATQRDAVGLDTDVAHQISELERWAGSTAHVTQFCSRHMGETVAAHGGPSAASDGAFVVPLGSEGIPPVLPASPTEQGVATVLYFGRFEERKGIDLLLDAIPSVLEQEDRVRFVLAGQDDLPDGRGSTFRKAFEAAHGGLVDRGAVVFEGAVDDARLAELMGAADLAVLPSRFESFGLVYVEAMSAGLPVVAVDGSGAEEVVADGATGRLCEPEARALADALVEVLSDGDALREMGRRGRLAFEERFTVAAMADRFLELFGLVSCSRPGDPDWPVPNPNLAELFDGSPGAAIDEGEAIEFDVPPGRTVLVLGGLGGSATVTVDSSGTSEVVEVSGQGFVHLQVGGHVRVENCSDGPLAIAALISVATGSGSSETVGGV